MKKSRYYGWIASAVFVIAMWKGPQEGTAAEEIVRGEERYTSAETVSATEFSAEELETWSNWFSEKSNYGFLLSEYQEPADIDLTMVYYMGAGIWQEPLTSTEKELYRKEFGAMNISTDIRKLTTEQINIHLEEKTGLTLEEMNQPLDWFYISELDTYYHQAGDTNYVTFTCTDGNITEDGMYEISYEDQYQWKVGTVTLKKEGENFLFVSNKLEK